MIQRQEVIKNKKQLKHNNPESKKIQKLDKEQVKFDNTCRNHIIDDNNIIFSPDKKKRYECFINKYNLLNIHMFWCIKYKFILYIFRKKHGD